MELIDIDCRLTALETARGLFALLHEPAPREEFRQNAADRFRLRWPWCVLL